MNVIDNTFAANGDITGVWPGGTGYLYCSGTFGSGTITLSAGDGGGNATKNAFVTVGATTTVSANCFVNFSAPAGFVLKATLTGSTSPVLHVIVATTY